MSNTINTLSPDFRDFLLNRNLITDTIDNNGLRPLLQGIGLPTNIDYTPNIVQPSEDIEVSGVFYKDLNTVQNKFQVEDSEYRSVDINNIPGNMSPFNVTDNSNFYQELNVTQNIYKPNDSDYEDVSIYLNNTNVPTIQYGPYLDEYGKLNVGGPSTDTLDLIGTILDGGGLGFNPNGGVVSDYDVRSSLSGRILNATGVINDTKLGKLGVGYLATAIGNNIAANVQKETIGKINLDPLSILKGGNIVGADYNITVPKGTLGSVVNILERMSGFETPVSLLSRSSSIFTSESGNISTIDRANSLINNSGKGQILSLFANLNANSDINLIGERIAYVPEYVDKRSERGFNQEPLDGGEIYLSDNVNSVIPKYTTELDENFNKDFGVEPISWGDDYNNKEGKEFDEAINSFFFINSFEKIGFNKKTILYKTQELFKSNQMKTLVSGHGVLNSENSKTQNVKKTFMSKGSAVLSKKAIESAVGLDPSEVFCRTWTTFDKYNNIENLQKHTGLNPSTRQNGETYTNSVLDDNGMVKIGPYDDLGGIKQFMFSIENLAWVGQEAKLLKSEQGPGDLITGNFGRIMWFPPYDMSFNETTSVNWDKNDFIGRGEPVYTYNNTERTGSLSWKIIVDHPNYMNFFPEEWGDDEITSFMAGCLDSEGIANTITTKEEREKIKAANITKQKEVIDDEVVEPLEFSIYFSNDNYEIPTLYENGLKNNSETPDEEIDYKLTPSGYEGVAIFFNGFEPTIVPTTPLITYGLKTTKGNGVVGPETSYYDDNTNFGLNGINQKITIPGSGNTYKGWQDDNFNETLNKYLKDKCKYCRLTVNGYASTPGSSNSNLELSKKRANSVKDWLLNSSNIIPTSDEFRGKRISQKYEGVGETDDSIEPCIEGRPDYLGCKKSRQVTIRIEYDPSLKKESEPNTSGMVDTNEPPKTARIPISRFFNEGTYFTKMEGDFVYNNIKDKIKHFHPGFHSITPEGFNSRLTFLQQCTRQGPTNKGGNSDNLAFGRPPVCILRIGDFYNTKIIIDNLSFDYEPLVWDLNPEGVGVQPMIVNITMSFSFIGGSSLNSPINRLQNAVSFNYFANTEVYDPRAQRVKLKNVIYAEGEKQGTSFGEIVDGVFPTTENVIKESELAEGINSENNNEIKEDQEKLVEETNKTEENTQELPDDASQLDNAKISGNINITAKGGYGHLVGAIEVLIGIFNVKLTKEYDVKLSFVSTRSLSGGQKIDMGTGKLVFDENKNLTRCIIKSDVNYGVLESGDIENNVGYKVLFTLSIPELNYTVGSFQKGLLTIDCPSQDFVYHEFISLDDLDDIAEDPCFECYSEPYDKKRPVIINGETCPLSGTTR